MNELPTLPKASKEARELWKSEVKKNLESLYAERRVGPIRDGCNAKSKNYPDEEIKPALNEIFKVLNDEVYDNIYENKAIPITIKQNKLEQDYTLQQVSKPKISRVWKNKDKTKGFVASKSTRSLIVAFYDTKKPMFKKKDANSD